MTAVPEQNWGQPKYACAPFFFLYGLEESCSERGVSHETKSPAPRQRGKGVRARVGLRGGGDQSETETRRPKIAKMDAANNPIGQGIGTRCLQTPSLYNMKFEKSQMKITGKARYQILFGL